MVGWRTGNSNRSNRICFNYSFFFVWLQQIAFVMYFLYQMLGISAIIGSTVCIVTMIPLQFLIGKKMSSNAKLTAVSIQYCTYLEFESFFPRSFLAFSVTYDEMIGIGSRSLLNATTLDCMLSAIVIDTLNIPNAFVSLCFTYN